MLASKLVDISMAIVSVRSSPLLINFLFSSFYRISLTNCSVILSSFWSSWKLHLSALFFLLHHKLVSSSRRLMRHIFQFQTLDPFVWFLHQVVFEQTPEIYWVFLLMLCDVVGLKKLSSFWAR